MKIQDFSGGLSTRLRPQYIRANEGAVYSNIDNTVGSLAPVKKALATTIETKRYSYFHEPSETWVGRDAASDFLEFQNKLYITNRAGRMKKFDGTSEEDAGLDIPPKLTSFTATEHPQTPNLITMDGTREASGLPEEDTYYAIFNVDAADRYSAGLIVLVTNDGNAGTYSSNTTDLPKPPIVKFNEPGFFRHVTLSNVTGIEYGALGVYVYRLYKNTYRLVGTLADENDSILDSVYDISANAAIDEDGLGVITGTVQYSMSYYDSSTGLESGLSTPSSEITFEFNGTVLLSSLPVSAQPQVDKKRLYRIGGGLTSFSLVEEIDNTITSYDDRNSNTAIDGSIATTEEDNPPPNGLSYIVESSAMLFGVVGNQVRFTPIGEPENWPVLFFIQYPVDITGLATVANGVLVFTRLRTYLITGTGPSVLVSQLLDSSQGCISMESVQQVGAAAIWASTDGLCTSDGGAVKVLTRAKLGKLTLTPVSSAIYDETYTCLNSDGSAIVFDYGNGGALKNVSLGVTSLVVAQDVFYGWLSGTLRKLYASTENESFSYLSPRFIEGSATEHKTYKKVYIYSKGDIILKILINDAVVITKALSTEDGHTIQVPIDLQRGFFIQFDISGTGEVYELEYLAGGRRND